MADSPKVCVWSEIRGLILLKNMCEHSSGATASAHCMQCLTYTHTHQRGKKNERHLGAQKCRNANLHFNWTKCFNCAHFVVCQVKLSGWSWHLLTASCTCLNVPERWCYHGVRTVSDCGLTTALYCPLMVDGVLACDVTSEGACKGEGWAHHFQTRRDISANCIS